MTGAANPVGVALTLIALVATAPMGGANAVLTVQTCLGRTIAIPIDDPDPAPRDDWACHAPACPDRGRRQDGAGRARTRHRRFHPGECP